MTRLERLAETIASTRPMSGGGSISVGAASPARDEASAMNSGNELFQACASTASRKPTGGASQRSQRRDVARARPSEAPNRPENIACPAMPSHA